MSAASRKKKNVDIEEDADTPKTSRSRRSAVSRSTTAENGDSASISTRVSFILPDEEIDQEFNTTLGLKPKVTRIDLSDIIADSSAISDREFSAVMESAAMSNIKQEVVNAINGEANTNNETDENLTTKRKRRKRKGKDVEGASPGPLPEKKKKKKVLDEIDIMSQNRKVYMRSRFTPKEKDMVFSFLL